MNPISGDCVACEVKGWHTERLTMSYWKDWPLLNFTCAPAIEVVRALVGDRPFRHILVAPPIGSRQRAEVIAHAAERGVELLEWPAVVERMLGLITVRKGARNQTDHVLRVLLTHGFRRCARRTGGRAMSSQPPEGRLVPAPPQLLEPQDRFLGLDAAVSDFWRWAFSDLRDNTVRGILPEFLVAAAVGRSNQRRKGWDNFDMETSSGLRVEVKALGLPADLVAGQALTAELRPRSSSELGREHQRVRRRARNPRRRVRARVHTCRDHVTYDALDIGQWEFYVVPAVPVRDCGYKSATVGWVRRHAEPVNYDRLATAMRVQGAKRLRLPIEGDACLITSR